MMDYSALANLETVQLDSIWNPRVLRLLEDLMCINFRVKHVSAKNNGVADYLSRLLSHENEVPDYPRLLWSYKPAAGIVSVVSEDDGTNYVYNLPGMAKDAYAWLPRLGN